MNQSGALLIMLGKKHGLYPQDPWKAYEDDWAIDNFGDIWKREFYTLWFKTEISAEEIEVAQEKFAKWNNCVEQKLL